MHYKNGLFGPSPSRLNQGASDSGKQLIAQATDVRADAIPNDPSRPKESFDEPQDSVRGA